MTTSVSINLDNAVLHNINIEELKEDLTGFALNWIAINRFRHEKKNKKSICGALYDESDTQMNYDDLLEEALTERFKL